MPKKPILLVLVLLLFYPPLAGAAADKAQKTTLTTPAQRFSYSYGIEVGGRLKTLATDIDLDSLCQAIRDAYSGAELAIPVKEAVVIRNEFNKKRNAEQREKRQRLAAANLAASQEFLGKNRQKKGIKTTASGLQYEVIKEGTGPKPARTDQVLMHYAGTLLDGSEFDNSYKRDKPLAFPMAGDKNIITGWTEGLQLMRVGSKYRLFIPPGLAYGDKQAGPAIGPNSLLIFEAEMMGIEQKTPGQGEKDADKKGK